MGLHEFLESLIEPGREEVPWADVAAVLTVGKFCGQAPEGLPLNFEVFSGNRADVTTVGEMVQKMEERFGKAQRVWVMDRGMVSEANISMLRERKALYLVGTPKSQLHAYEAELAEKENWTDVHPRVEARLVAHPDGDGQERFVLCRSTARGAKERAMLERQMTGLTAELAKMDAALRRRPATDVGPKVRPLGSERKPSRPLSVQCKWETESSRWIWESSYPADQEFRLNPNDRESNVC
jgi:hypothetical protein